MSLITPRIYLGDANNAKDANFLQSKKIMLIINCAKEIPNYFPNAVKYIRLDLNDVPEQPITDALKHASDAILHAIDHKVTTFVHCAAGISRSSSVVIFTLMRLYDWDFQKAYSFVKNMHPRTHPNPGFVKQLNSLQNSLQKQEIESQDSILIETSIDEEPNELYGVKQSAEKTDTSLTLDNNHARPTYARSPKNPYAKISK